MWRNYSFRICCLLALFRGTARADDFWQHWGDGKAVLIFVTEDFSDSLRVKADPGKHPASDVYPVLKLNFVRDFQTGVYDYNVMTSTFLKTESGFAPAKVSFSAQEWCGHTY